MDNLFFAADGSASAHASVRLTGLGFVGVVRFAVDCEAKTALRHECVRYRDARDEALRDARVDAQILVRRWVDERVRLGDA